MDVKCDVCGDRTFFRSWIGACCAVGRCSGRYRDVQEPSVGYTVITTADRMSNGALWESKEAWEAFIRTGIAEGERDALRAEIARLREENEELLDGINTAEEQLARLRTAAKVWVPLADTDVLYLAVVGTSYFPTPNERRAFLAAMEEK
jgi:hypothetical protein